MGAYLDAPKTTKSTRYGNDESMEFAVSEMQGWRLSMEDADIAYLNIDQKNSIFGVFDGHGGSEVALFVKSVFIDEFKKNNHYKVGEYDKALQETFVQIDRILLSDYGQQQLQDILSRLPENPDDPDATRPGDLSNAGCTSVVALVNPEQIVVANAGDSRCVIAVQGQAVEMSVDHKPDLAEERERIQAAGGSISFDGRVNGNLNLSRSIGDLEYKRNPDISLERQMITSFPEIKTHAMANDVDFMVLACDGIWDIMTSQQCVDFVYQRLENTPLQNIVEQILDHCLAPDTTSRGGLGCDNMTCIVVRFKH